MPTIPSCRDDEAFTLSLFDNTALSSWTDPAPLQAVDGIV